MSFSFIRRALFLSTGENIADFSISGAGKVEALKLNTSATITRISNGPVPGEDDGVPISARAGVSLFQQLKKLNDQKMLEEFERQKLEEQKMLELERQKAIDLFRGIRGGMATMGPPQEPGAFGGDNKVSTGGTCDQEATTPACQPSDCVGPETRTGIQGHHLSTAPGNRTDAVEPLQAGMVQDGKGHPKVLPHQEPKCGQEATTQACQPSDCAGPATHTGTQGDAASVPSHQRRTLVDVPKFTVTLPTSGPSLELKQIVSPLILLSGPTEFEEQAEDIKDDRPLTSRLPKK